MTQTLEPDDPLYPTGLHDLTPPPPLRIRGQLPAATGVAIVGSREATERSLALAHDLARGLGELGVPIWSGGAVGIDAAAHAGALAAGIPTVAVFGGGMDRPYPAENHGLFEEMVLRGGALVSVEADDTDPSPGRFFTRNRVLAAATRLLVVVECGIKSGARNAAGHARRLGRPVLVVPHSPWSRGAGAVLELKLGGFAIDGEADVMTFLGRPPAPAPPPRPTRKRAARARPAPSDQAAPQLDLALDLGDDERRVLTLLSSGSSSADQICDGLGWPYERVAPLLLELILRGLVLETSRGLALSRL